MAAISISHDVAAPVDRVWAELERIEDHAEWMTDAVAIEFATEQRRGVGTRISVETKVGPLRTTDQMEFVRWDAPTAMGVSHQGLVGGVGEFTLGAIPTGGTRITWREDLTFPWYFGGPIGAWFAKPVLRRIWMGNLRSLAQRL